MKNRCLLYISISLLFLFFIRCSNNVAGSDGGGASETINCRVISSSGLPESNAVVRVIDADNWLVKRKNGLSVVLDSTTTDQNGYFSAFYDTNLSINLQIDGGSEAVFVNKYQRYDSNQDRPVINLSQKIKVLGTISSSNKFLSADLYGTAYTIPLDDNLIHAEFAPGNYPVLLMDENSNYVHNSNLNIPENHKEDLLVEIKPDQILIDDFNHFDPYQSSALGMITGGKWYRYSDSIQISQGYSTVVLSIFQENAFEEKSLSSKVVLGNGLRFPFAGFGINIGTEGKKYDFSKIKEISFWGRGNCQIRFSVETFVIDSIKEADAIHFHKIISLTNTWSKHTISTNELVLLPESKAAQLGITWDDVMHSVVRIEIEFPHDMNKVGDTLELDLDNLYMDGTIDNLAY